MSCLFRLAAFSLQLSTSYSAFICPVRRFYNEKHVGSDWKATKQKKRLPKRDRTVKSTWTDGEKQDLIINVEHWEVIWNVALEDFKDEQKRNDAWVEVGKAVGKSGKLLFIFCCEEAYHKVSKFHHKAQSFFYSLKFNQI